MRNSAESDAESGHHDGSPSLHAPHSPAIASRPHGVGADEAFATLVVRYERKLIRVLMRMVHEEELARDLAQETFWKVYNRLDRFDTARRFGPWLFRVGVNLGLDLLRRHEPPPATSIDRARDDG